mmetsp:Transcript_12152/g.30752  ORF Transcript_12152/g.30752 Transcript_12152/m.30752 type:complete len:257 (-) Transcript_12152:394-1164(-)
MYAMALPFFWCIRLPGCQLARPPGSESCFVDGVKSSRSIQHLPKYSSPRQILEISGPQLTYCFAHGNLATSSKVSVLSKLPWSPIMAISASARLFRKLSTSYLLVADEIMGTFPGPNMPWRKSMSLASASFSVIPESQCMKSTSWPMICFVATPVWTVPRPPRAIFLDWCLTPNRAKTPSRIHCTCRVKLCVKWFPWPAVELCPAVAKIKLSSVMTACKSRRLRFSMLLWVVHPTCLAQSSLSILMSPSKFSYLSM